MPCARSCCLIASTRLAEVLIPKGLRSGITQRYWPDHRLSGRKDNLRRRARLARLAPAMDDSKTLLINLILYGLLPLWGIAGFIDWCCHRATRVESTSGIKESLMHSLMGIQLGVPILL